MLFRGHKNAYNDFVGHPTNHGAELKIDLQAKSEWVIDMFWKMDGTMTFIEFMEFAIIEMTPGRRYGYVRLFLYPTKKAFEDNGSNYIAIFIRKLDIYVVAIEDIDRITREIGRDCESETERYFYNTRPTGFGQQYSQFFKGTGVTGDLVGAWIGFSALNEAILRVIRKNKEPSDWAWSIGIFALTFSECIRFVWSLHRVNNFIADRRDNRMDGEYKYMAKIPKEWKTISLCARRNMSEPTNPQPDSELYTMVGLDNLKLYGKYAAESLNIKSWCYGDRFLVEHNEPGGARDGPAYGDGGGTYY